MRLGALVLALSLLAAPVAAETPATITDRSRNMDQIDDFLRVIFLPPGVKPTTLGAPAALRVFFGASAFYRPPLSLGETLDFPGIPDRATQDLVALRCVPPAQIVEPTLATWPNVFAMITADLGGPYTCPAPAGAAENEVVCLARGFTDEPSPVASMPVHQALGVGVAMLADPARADVLRRRYGIFPAFSGLGFSVKGSGNGAPMLGADVLRRSVVPEYLLRNVSLAAAGCRCISVPPYPGREAAPLDPDQISREGGDGRCVDVSQLGTRLTRFVTDVYLDLLGRAPDAKGLQSWTNSLQASCNTGGFVNLAAGFLSSSEFLTTRALTLPNLVGALHRAFLGREPTPAEFGAGVVLLRALRERGANVILASAEFNALVPPSADAVASAVRRLYEQMLQRTPSPNEVSAWVGYVLSTGDWPGTVATFVTSSDFEARALTGQDFVAILYRALLARNPDPGGLESQERLWSDGLVQAVGNVLIASPEFQATLPQLCGS